jgi:flagellar biosynthetic protein FliP
MIGVICHIVLLLGLISSSVGQTNHRPEADRRGWKAAPDRVNSEQPGLNQPFSIRAEAAESIASIPSKVPMPSTGELRFNQPMTLNASSPILPDNDVRRQIGLASFDETPDSKSSATVKQEPAKEFADRLIDRSLPDLLSQPLDTVAGPAGICGSIKFVVLLGALSLAPAIVLMTTSYVRVVVVLSLLKQAFGGQLLPPAQVVTALSLFISILIMTPVWKDLKKHALDPYAAEEIEWNEAWERGLVPIKSFMVRQIKLAGNEDSVAVFYKYADVGSSLPPSDISEVPLNVLIPAFMISELKIAFLLGFQIFLPFLVLDLIVSSVTVSMGMMMLPPQMVSFPLKLVLFVLVDGWNLVIGMLLQSFGTLM